MFFPKYCKILLCTKSKLGIIGVFIFKRIIFDIIAGAYSLLILNCFVKNLTKVLNPHYNLFLSIFKCLVEVIFGHSPMRNFDLPNV